jgi:hypothetical protein
VGSYPWQGKFAHRPSHRPGSAYERVNRCRRNRTSRAAARDDFPGATTSAAGHEPAAYVPCRSIDYFIECRRNQCHVRTYSNVAYGPEWREHRNSIRRVVLDDYLERAGCSTIGRRAKAGPRAIHRIVWQNSQTTARTAASKEAVSKRKDHPLVVIPTSYPRTPQVSLLPERWQHIQQRHPEVAQNQLVAATQNVSIVFPGNAPNTVMFVNPQVTYGGRTPLGVIVNEEESTIVTAYYNRSINLVPMSQALWLLPKK